MDTRLVKGHVYLLLKPDQLARLAALAQPHDALARFVDAADGYTEQDPDQDVMVYIAAEEADHIAALLPSLDLPEATAASERITQRSHGPDAYHDNNTNTTPPSPGPSPD